MSEQPTLGSILNGGETRDAIHVAIEPVVAGENLTPGQRVGLLEDGTASNSAEHVGIVDPFLTEWVSKGQRFYLCLFPGTVTGMRHHWEHPAFSSVEGGVSVSNLIASLSDKQKSELWLREYAKGFNSYDDDETAFNSLIEGLKTGELYAHGSDLHGFYELDDADELKEHAEKYLGITINWGGFEFSCSC